MFTIFIYIQLRNTKRVPQIPGYQLACEIPEEQIKLSVINQETEHRRRSSSSPSNTIWSLIRWEWQNFCRLSPRKNFQRLPSPCKNAPQTYTWCFAKNIQIFGLLKPHHLHHHHHGVQVRCTDRRERAVGGFYPLSSSPPLSEKIEPFGIFGKALFIIIVVTDIFIIVVNKSIISPFTEVL